MSSATDFAVEKVVLVDITLDYCDEVHSTAPCTATRNPGGECYNTFGTCQDTANYNHNAGRVYRFTMVDGPLLRGVNAYRSLVSVSPIVGRIDPRRGLGGRDQINLAFIDALDLVDDADPYASGRGTIQGTFWRKLLARNRNHVGRAMAVKTGYLDANGYLDESSMDTREYILEEITLGARGTVRVTARDPLKLTERVMIPEPSDAELAAAITDSATSATLTTGHNLSDGAVVLRLEDEIITGTLTTDTLSSITRAAYGTTAKAHAANRRVQLCKVWSSQNIDDTWADILTDSGLAAGNIDTAGAATEIDLWHPSITIDGVVISKPTRADKLLRDLMEQTSCMTWWDPEDQKAKIRAIHPRLPSATGTAVNDTAHIVQDSALIQYLEPERVTRVAVYYGVEDWSRDFSDFDPDEPAYGRVQYVIDTDAESAEEYGAARPRTVFGYFLGTSLTYEVKAAAFRMLARLRDAPRRITLRVTDKVADALSLASEVDLTTDELVDVTGAPVAGVETLVHSMKPPAGPTSIEWTLELEPTTLDGLWGWYQENTITSTHPTASAEELKRAFYSDSNGLYADGTPGAHYV